MTAGFGSWTRRQLAAAGAALGAVEAIAVWRIGPHAVLAAFCYLGLVGTAVSLVDLRARRLPNRVVLPSYPITIALLAVVSGIDQDWWPLARAVIAAAVVAGFYVVLGLAFTGGLGLGDAKLGGLLALGLGWLGWNTLVTGILAAWGLAALALLVQRVAQPDRRARTMALGPWLCLGALVAVLLL